MKILLTGATGFIGSQVARRLLEAGQVVYTLIRPGSNTYRIQDIIHSLKVVPLDLFSIRELDETLERIRPELCVHMAWYAEPGLYLSSPDNLRCLSASLKLAMRLADLGCKRFVGGGTCFEYDTTQGNLSARSATDPRSLYAATKLGCYLALNQLGRLTGMETAWLRFFYIYGPYENERRLVPYVITALLGNREVKVTKGEQVRDFLHVEDLAAAVWDVAQSPLTGIVNVGSGQPITVRDLVGRIGEILGLSELIQWGAVPYSDEEPMYICADVARLVKNTHWVPRYDLDRGLRHTISWWKAHLRCDLP